MKKLLLLRHAEAIPAAESIDDFHRALSPRGQKEIAFVAEKLQQQGWQPSLIFASSATRTLQTAHSLIKNAGFSHAALRESRDIYVAHLPMLLEIIATIESTHETVILVGHNPTLYELASWLCEPQEIDRLLQHGLPTCGLIAFSLEITGWEKLQQGCGTINQLIVPTL